MSGNELRDIHLFSRKLISEGVKKSLLLRAHLAYKASTIQSYSMSTIPIRQLQTAPQPPHFNIRDLRYLLDGQDMTQTLHRHDFFYVLALKEAEGQHDIDFVSYPVSNYNVFIVRPGQVHSLLLKAGSNGYLMQFNDVFYAGNDYGSRQILRKAGSINRYQLEAAQFEKLAGILKAITNEYILRQKKYLEVMQANMAIFFIELIRASTSADITIEQYHIQEKLETLLDLIGTNISTCKQVSQYAEMMHLSTYQLNAITKQTLQKTCSELISDHIILEAKRYLLATPDQISTIAAHLGYEDVSYFIRLFRKHTGHTPEAFRQNFR
ncbi:AraC family transcriptional regulator [Chitinophaga rhizophila]|uniref:Helix-turn-helix domain-containing protein n=1 Tax=Chitinophaga rhizophila TaxID=2866212 RepID=A0ABS7GIJ2_9BACT|nr:helix-turn-helix domain-containing protein [Chitinophaga rhizophila]MBW8687499.1 helix-turn-helix domain-containing protein [Chitinophaga rhizophila]